MHGWKLNAIIAQEPKTVDEALIAIILFALSDCQSDRRNFKHKGSYMPPHQAFVALDLIPFLTNGRLATNQQEIFQIGRWLSFKSTSKMKDVRKWAKDYSHNKTCNLCNCACKHCQLPAYYRPSLGRGSGPGFCIRDAMWTYLSSGVLTYDKPTGWKLIDDVLFRDDDN